MNMILPVFGGFCVLLHRLRSRIILISLCLIVFTNLNSVVSLNTLEQITSSSNHSQQTVNHIARYKTVYACEGKVLEIICEEGYLIHLIRANYGRYSISICNDHGNLDWKVDCTSPHSYEVISKRCHSMRDCNITVSSNIFQDHCPGTYKYLEVQYDCLPKVIQNLESTVDSKSWLSTHKLKPGNSGLSSSSSLRHDDVSHPLSPTSRPPIIVPITSTTRASTTSPPPPVVSPSSSGLSLGGGSINLRTFTSTMFPPSTVWKQSSDNFPSPPPPPPTSSSSTTKAPSIANQFHHWNTNGGNGNDAINQAVTISTSTPWKSTKVKITNGKQQPTPMPNYHSTILPNTLIVSSAINNKHQSLGSMASSSSSSTTTTTLAPSYEGDGLKRATTIFPWLKARLPPNSGTQSAGDDHHDIHDSFSQSTSSSDSDSHYSGYPSGSVWSFSPNINASASKLPSSSSSDNSRINRSRTTNLLIIVLISSIIAIIIYSITLLLLIISRITNHRQIIHKNICFILILSSVILSIISLEPWTESTSSICNTIGICLHFLVQAIFNLIFIDSIRVYCCSGSPLPGSSSLTSSCSSSNSCYNNNNNNNINNNNNTTSSTSSTSSNSSATSSTSFSSSSPSAASSASSSSTTAFSSHLDCDNNKQIDSPSSTLSSTVNHNQPTSISTTNGKQSTPTTTTIQSALSLISKESVTLYLVTYGLPVITIGTSFLIDPTLVYRGLTPGSAGGLTSSSSSSSNSLLITLCWFSSTSNHFFQTSLWVFLPTFLSIFFTALLILLTIYAKMSPSSSSSSSSSSSPQPPPPPSIQEIGSSIVPPPLNLQPPPSSGLPIYGSAHSHYNQQQASQNQSNNLIDYKTGLNVTDSSSVSIIQQSGYNGNNTQQRTVPTTGNRHNSGHRHRHRNHNNNHRHHHHHHHHHHHRRQFENNWQPTLYLLLLECCFWLMFNIYLTTSITNLTVTIIFSLLNVISAAGLCTITFVRNRRARHNVRKWLTTVKWLPSCLRFNGSSNIGPSGTTGPLSSGHNLGSNGAAPMTACFYSLDPSHLMSPPSPIIKLTSSLSNCSSSRLHGINTVNNTINRLQHHHHHGQQQQQQQQHNLHHQQQFIRSLNDANSNNTLRASQETLSLHHPSLTLGGGGVGVLGGLPRHIPEVSPYAPPVPIYLHEYEDISSNLATESYSFIGQPRVGEPTNSYYYHTTRSPIYYSDRKQISP